MPSSASQADPDPSPPAPPGATAWALRALGAAIGLGLLAWCVSLALSPRNREALEQIEHAPPGSIAALLGLSVLIIAANGVQFRTVLAPVRAMSTLHLVAINVVITALNYLPFRIGTIARVVIHTRRDAMPLAEVGAWLAAFAAVTGAVLGPLVVVSVLHSLALAPEQRPTIDAAWIAGAAGGMALAFAALVLVARRAARWRASAPPEARVLGSPHVQRLLSAADMAASPKWTLAGMACRLAEIGLQAGRFVVAGTLIGHDIAAADAVLVASTYFIVGLLSPFGQAGPREMAVVALAGSEEFAVIALLVTAAEAATSTVLAAPTAIALRLDRVFIRSR